MAYTVNYDEVTTILTVVQEGEVTLESRLQVLAEIKAKLPEGADVKVLSDLRNADINMSSDELLKFGTIVAGEPRSRRACIATVYKIDDPIKFLSETMVLLEGDNIRIVTFTSIDEAREWLISEC